MTSDGALAALHEEAGDAPTYAALLELLVLASLDELTVLVDLPGSGIAPMREVRRAPPSGTVPPPPAVDRRRRRSV